MGVDRKDRLVKVENALGSQAAFVKLEDMIEKLSAEVQYLRISLHEVSGSCVHSTAESQQRNVTDEMLNRAASEQQHMKSKTTDVIVAHPVKALSIDEDCEGEEDSLEEEESEEGCECEEKESEEESSDDQEEEEVVAVEGVNERQVLPKFDDDVDGDDLDDDDDDDEEEEEDERVSSEDESVDVPEIEDLVESDTREYDGQRRLAKFGTIYEAIEFKSFYGRAWKKWWLIASTAEEKG